MNYADFVQQLDDEQVSAAIQEAEGRTSGEICVCISRRRTKDAMATATRLFGKFQMHRTRQRNGVLILVAPASRATAIFGDEGIHRIAGPGLWSEVIELLSAELAGDPTGALVDAVERVASTLAEHFPPTDDDIDELPNEVRHD